MIGGLAGRPYAVPNGKVKRGYSLRKAYWRFPPPLPVVVAGIGSEGGCYKLTELAGKAVYLYDPEPPQVDPEVDLAAQREVARAVAWRAHVLRSVGSQRFWRGRF